MDYLEHHGIKGQRWGIRRFQNKDGTLTKAGKLRAYKQSNAIYNTLSKDQQRHASYTDEPNVFMNKEEYLSLSKNAFVKKDKGKASSILNIVAGGKDDEVEFQVMTRNDKQGRGYASRLVDKGIKWAKDTQKNSIIWQVSLNNDASIKLAKKKGFEFTRNLMYDWNGEHFVPSTAVYTKRL